MQHVLQDHEFVRLVKEELTPQHTVYRIEVEGEGTLYSFDNHHTAVQYFDMLLRPFFAEARRRLRAASSRKVSADPPALV
ncbi:hypothetical protein EZI54_21565 [Marinobacter halodurans]|uniref:KTSC domain-containing protein n=1 Tax=Marinobacter halodurans TaxID=2528979 RepID=A0ABY1ZI82_9GAMM|nr:hypothetical protein [Marinobacter halodurans]TBW48227.1 hypothetical protein EZI54_21565 [Marinobacter halodurans]